MGGYRAHLGFWFGGLNAIPEAGMFDDDCAAPVSTTWGDCTPEATSWAAASAESTSWSRG